MKPAAGGLRIGPLIMNGIFDRYSIEFLMLLKGYFVGNARPMFGSICKILGERGEKVSNIHVLDTMNSNKILQKEEQGAKEAGQ